MKEIPLTRGKVAIVDDADYEILSRYRWYYADNGPHKTGYAAHRETYAVGKSRILFMHNVIMGERPGLLTDHINGNGLENWRENLRHCTVEQNNHNLPAHRDGKSHFKGVCWSASKDKWRANICIGRRQTHLGYFVVEEDAARAYNVAAQKNYGEFAWLNEVTA